jgi:predicted RNA-binding Zn-ribbon protein involved in translation (DUF1610 family)
MTERKDAKGFGRRYGRRNLLYFLPALVFLCIGWWSVERSGILLVISILGFLISILVGPVVEGRTLSRFKCPDCGKAIKAPTVNRPEPIIYYCDKCDIEWDTGMYIADDNHYRNITR